jgi:death-on-curing protein
MSAKLVWIDERDVLILHDALIARFGGGEGLRNQPLLQSALARAPQLLAYGKRVDAIQLAAAYTAGLVGNHPFVDGNKRTGFLVGVLFLELNGYRFTASEEEAAQAVLALASATLDEAGYAAFLRVNARKITP